MLKNILIALTIIFMAMIFAGESFAQGTQETISLKQGFNFISFTIAPDLTPDQLKQNYSSLIEDIYLYSSAAGSFLSLSEGTLASISAGKGYIIKSKADSAISVSGTSVTTVANVSLKSGFNLIGMSVTVTSVSFSDLMKNYVVIKGLYKWSAAAGSFIQVVTGTDGTPQLLDGGDPKLNKGESYFINVSGDSVMSFSGGAISLTGGDVPLKAVTPVISPASGTYTAAQSVTIATTTAGADIYYTIDGSTPSTASSKYSSAISVSSSLTIKAIAVKSGIGASDITSAAYTINTVQPAGETLKIDLGGGVMLEMIKIPAGTFQMGQVGVAEPVHTVTLSKYYYMAKYETTVGQWKKIMGSDPSLYKKDDNYPVESVSWNDCQNFISILNKNYSGYGIFRLPTEAEWEYACRAGTQTIFYWGDSTSETEMDKYCWYYRNSGYTRHPVGQKLPNAFGLYDMCGNVWEWCNDWSESYSNTSVVDPIGPIYSNNGLNSRGGSFSYVITGCYSATRGGGSREPSEINNVQGFRLALAPDNYSQPGNSTIDKNTAIFDKKTENQVDISVTINPNGNTLASIKNDTELLPYGNYGFTIAGNLVTIKKNYLAYMPVGTTILTFKFRAGNDQTLTITVLDSSIVDQPVISHASGIYSSSQMVTITSATSGATIKYTMDGSTPSATNGIVYNSAINISSTTTIKAIAIKAGLTDSRVASTALSINLLPQTLVIDLGSGVTLEMVKISAAGKSFQMGSPETEEGRELIEGPVHTVSFTKDYYIGKFEVTQAQWVKICGSWPSTAPSSNYGMGDTYPAYYISFDDICYTGGFLDKINTLIPSGYNCFRLPTEAEWEYACRANTQTRFYWGDDLLHTLINDYAWHNNNSGLTSHPVGQKLPNEFGLYDMLGNVNEWCGDRYEDYSSLAVTDPIGTKSVTFIYRGGNYTSAAYKDCRAAYRNVNYSAYNSQKIGFRLILPLGQ